MDYSLAELGEINKSIWLPARFSKPVRQARKVERSLLQANKKAARQRAIAAGAAHPGLYARGESASAGAMDTARAKTDAFVHDPKLDQRVRDLGAKATEGAAERVPELATTASRNAAIAARENAIPNRKRLLTLGIGGGAAFGAGTATVPWAAREAKKRKQALLGSSEEDNTQPNYG